MINDESQKQLQDIIRGAIVKGQEDHCTTVGNLICQSFGTNPTIKKEFESRKILKEKQADFLRQLANNSGFWLSSLPPSVKYLTRGGEAKVYLATDKRNIIKVNDAVYYATWMEYFNSLVIHNLLFPSTAYSLIGFTEDSDKNLCFVIGQPFIEGEQAELSAIKELLTFNGFVNKKRQDY